MVSFNISFLASQSYFNIQPWQLLLAVLCLRILIGFLFNHLTCTSRRNWMMVDVYFRELQSLHFIQKEGKCMSDLIGKIFCIFTSPDYYDFH